MNPENPGEAQRKTIHWLRAGIVAGFATCIFYPLVTMASLPRIPLVVLAASIGPLLAVASLGLRRALWLHEDSVTADLGALFNIVAGALLVAMLLVQLAVRLHASGHAVAQDTVGVWLGLDVAWDVYIGLGTGCFALAMMRHPRFGSTMGVVGLVLAAALLALNLLDFPTPPAEAGKVDVAPAIGLWYLVATLLVWRAMPWLTQMAKERYGPG